MPTAETWIPPFDDDGGSIKFHWPAYTELKGKMVEVHRSLSKRTTKAAFPSGLFHHTSLESLHVIETKGNLDSFENGYH
jgi:hypothetical protein